MTLSGVRSGSSNGPKRILIDSMIVDLILATPGLIEKVRRAGAQGALLIVETHILRDQLSATPDAARRRQLFEVYEALPRKAVQTRGFVLDVSRLDEAELTDEAEAAVIERLTTSGGLRGRSDALLAATASGKADALVTEDNRLLNRLAGSRVTCQVWRFDDFRQFVEGSMKRSTTDAINRSVTKEDRDDVF